MTKRCGWYIDIKAWTLQTKSSLNARVHVDFVPGERFHSGDSEFFYQNSATLHFVKCHTIVRLNTYSNIPLTLVTLLGYLFNFNSFGAC